MTAIIYTIKKLLSTFLALFLLIGSSNSGATHTVLDEDSCELNFTVLSDVHMESNRKTSRDAFIKIMYDVKNNEVGCDALVFLGDNTMNGQDIENMFFYGILDRINPADTIYTAIGNHDTGNGTDKYDKLSARFWNYHNTFHDNDVTGPYYYKIVNGYYFIFLGSESDNVNTTNISVEQIQWLESVLALATENGKPAFVFNHHPYNYLTENNDLFKEVLTAYDNVFYFSGHTHTQVPIIYDIDEGTHYYNLPRCTELNDDDSIADGVCGIGLQVEVYDGSVVVRLRNYYTSEWIEDFTYDLI
ncbi:MAG: metallophosphoesterase [Clostridiales bacterium]|nr:metallophosphoesterase [Clostridiales bacterium]MCD7828354.1 metallophosphoesterase [Clostridiales bacterium]